MCIPALFLFLMLFTVSCISLTVTSQSFARTASLCHILSCLVVLMCCSFILNFLLPSCQCGQLEWYPLSRLLQAHFFPTCFLYSSAMFVSFNSHVFSPRIQNIISVFIDWHPPSWAEALRGHEKCGVSTVECLRESMITGLHLTRLPRNSLFGQKELGTT